MSIPRANLQEFIHNYNTQDAPYLDLDWNGKFGAKFKDANLSFRLQIAEQVYYEIQSVDLELLKDLFIALGRTTQLNFKVHPYFHVFIQELLQRGGKQYLFEYICAAHISYDTFMATSTICLSEDRKIELLEYFDYLKATQPNVSKLFIQAIRDRFIV